MSKKKILSICTTVTLVGGIGLGIPLTQTQAAAKHFGAGTHSWVVPQGVTSVNLTVLGAGGGGARFGTPEKSAAGGAGAKVTVKSLKVTPGDALTFGVGRSGSSSFPANGGGGGGAATIVYKGSPTSSGLLVVAGGGGGGGSMDATTNSALSNGASGAAAGTSAGGNTPGKPAGDGGCGASMGGSGGVGGTIPDPLSCRTGADGGAGGNGLFGNGGPGANSNGDVAAGTLIESGTGVGGAAGAHVNYFAGGGGGGYGGGAGGVALNPGQIGLGGAGGGSGVFNAAKLATTSYAPGANGGQPGAAGSDGSVALTWGVPSSSPNKPAKVKVSGKPTSSKRTVAWTPPKAGATPTGYRVTIKVRSSGKAVYRKNFGPKVRHISVSKSYLLKKTYRTRGEVGGNVRYRAYVQAKSGKLLSKARTVGFRISG